MEKHNNIKLQIYKDNGIESWSGYKQALLNYETKTGSKIKNSIDILNALSESNISSWRNYEKASAEYIGYYYREIESKYRLVNIKDYSKINQLDLDKNNISKHNRMTEMLEAEIKRDINMEYVFESPILSSIAKEVKKVFINDTDLDIAIKVKRFEKESKFFTPNNKKGLDLLYKAQNYCNSIYKDYNPSANEYLLITKPIYLALAIKENYLKNQIEEFFRI